MVALRLLLVAATVLLAGCGEASEPVATHLVVIPGAWVFEPETAQVQVGVPVVFRNDGGAAHTVTIEELGLDRTLRPGESLEHVFGRAGTYEVVCRLHPPAMAGTIVATEA